MGSLKFGIACDVVGFERRKIAGRGGVFVTCMKRKKVGGFLRGFWVCVRWVG